MQTLATAPPGITRRQLFVLSIAYLGWVFDLMDVFLMVLVKDRAMAELLGPGATQKEVGAWGGWALGITLVGWSAGGLLFGMVADRWGRTRTMALTILVYSVFTGLTGLGADGPADCWFCASSRSRGQVTKNDDA